MRAKGTPTWVKLRGTGPDQHWTAEDARLPGSVRDALAKPPRAATKSELSGLASLRAQRLEPLEAALKDTPDGLPVARRLIVLPSAAMAGIPVEAILPPGDLRTISYAPSATLLSYLRKQPRPDPSSGFLALGDPDFTRPDTSSAPGPLPDRGLLINVVIPGSNAATHGLKDGDVLLAYNGHSIKSKDDLKVILTQTGLPDPLAETLAHKPVFDGRLTVREIQRSSELHAELVTPSACETALGRSAGGEGIIGFSQALLMSGTRSVCLSLWKVDDTATALLMQRCYANLLGQRAGLSRPLPKAEALAEAKAWLRGLPRAEALTLAADMEAGLARSKGATRRQPAEVAAALPGTNVDDHPYTHPYYWAAFILVGDPE